jgi:hypothetical protein
MTYKELQTALKELKELGSDIKLNSKKEILEAEYIRLTEQKQINQEPEQINQEPEQIEETKMSIQEVSNNQSITKVETIEETKMTNQSIAKVETIEETKMIIKEVAKDSAESFAIATLTVLFIIWDAITELIKWIWEKEQTKELITRLEDEITEWRWQLEKKVYNLKRQAIAQFAR